MSVRASRYLHEANESYKMFSPAPNEIISAKTEPTNSRRRRVMRTGDLIHFDLDSSPKSEKRVVSRTKSIDEGTSRKKRVKTPFRSVKKVKTSVAADLSQKKRKSVLPISSSRGKNISLKEWEESVNPFEAVNLDTEFASAEANLEKSSKTPTKINAHGTPHSSVVSSSKKSRCVTPNPLPKLINNNANNNEYRLSGVKLFESSDADFIERENNTFVLVNSDHPQAKSPLVENAQKRKSSESPFKSNKKVKAITTPKSKADSPTKGQNSAVILKVEENSLLKSPQTEKNVQKSPERSLPAENVQPKRKIVRAKRLLNHTNQLNSNESAINTVSEVQTSLKKKRKTWQRQNNFDMDSFSGLNNGNVENKDKENTVEVVESDGGEEDGNKPNEIKENTDGEDEETSSKEETEAKHAKEMEVIEIIDLVGEASSCLEERKEKITNSFELVVTTCEEPISPSTTNPDVHPSNKSLSPLANLLHFDFSEEEIQPSTSGLTPEITSRRRTYELQESINDVSVLKTVSEQDSVRINSSRTDLPFSDAAVTRSKVTMRRRIENNDDFFSSRISKITPPWLTEDEFDSEEKSSPETSTPMPASKGRFTLLKEVLTKKEQQPIFRDFTRKMSTSLVNNGNTNTQNSANKKRHTPQILLKNASTTKKSGSNVKIPNFAAIHKRALDKIENISEYKKRKEERAQMLLSGKKPPALQIPKKQTKKQLRFDPGTCDNPKPLNFIPLPTTPLPKRVFNQSLDKTITPVEIRVPEFKFVASKENLFSIPKGITPKSNSTSTSNVAKVRVLTPKNYNMKEAFRFGYNGNRFGFKMAKPAAIVKKEEVKAMVATKSKAVKNVVESRRAMIKGVRSNRRFELLMNMRKGK